MNDYPELVVDPKQEKEKFAVRREELVAFEMGDVIKFKDLDFGLFVSADPLTRGHAIYLDSEIEWKLVESGGGAYLIGIKE